MNDRTLYSLHNSVILLQTSDSLVLTLGALVQRVEGEAAPLIRSILQLLTTPRTVEEIIDLSGHDGEDVEVVLDWLREQGFAEPTRRFTPRSDRMRSAVRRGVTVLGLTATAAAIADAMRAEGLAVEGPLPASAAAVKAARGLVIGTFAALVDPVARQLTEAALEVNADYLQVITGPGDVAWMGPLVSPSGPCPHCLALRLLGRGHEHQLMLFHLAADEGAQVVTLAEHRHRAFRIAAAVVGFTAGLADDGSFAVTSAYDGTREAALRLDLSTGLTDAHRVMRHAHCVVCKPLPAPPRTADADVIAQGKQQAEQRWREILADDPESLPPSNRIIQEYFDVEVGPFFYREEWENRERYFRKFPLCWGGLSLVRDREWASTGYQGINGTGPTLEHRRLVSISEAIERYAQGTHRPALEGVPYRDVRDVAIDPRNLCLYAEEQYKLPDFPRPRFTEEHPLNWTWGVNLRTGEARLFPEEIVTVARRDDQYENRILEQNLTSGGASHRSYRRALNNGLRELIERDAYMIAWYKRIPLTPVRLPDRLESEYAQELLDFVRGHDIEVSVLDMRLDFEIPTYLFIGRIRSTQGSWDAGGTVLVAVSDLNPMAALERGLCELSLHWETLVVTPGPAKHWSNTPYNPEDMSLGWRTWWPMYQYYLNPANASKLDFLSTGPGVVDFSELPDFSTGTPEGDLEVFLRLLDARKLEAWVWDLVNFEVAESGFRVAKAIVPGLVEMTAGKQSRRLTSPRLEQIAEKVGRGLPRGVFNEDCQPNA